jgi:hypothetical protein
MDNNNHVNENVVKSTKIQEIQSSFIENYHTNLGSFIPTIYQEFLNRVEYKDKTLIKKPEELNFKRKEKKNIDLIQQTNINFRQQIYLDFVLNGMKQIEIFEKNSNDTKQVDEIYKKYNYDISFDIVKPIQELINDSIIPKYDKIPQSDIGLNLIHAHGGVKRTIKKLQPNCIVVLITPSNRLGLSHIPTSDSIKNIITKISQTIGDFNNIYDIVKMIEQYKCFDKSTIIFPEQYYFDYELITEVDRGMCGMYVNPKSYEFEYFKETFNTSLEKYIQDYIESHSDQNKVNIFFVQACRSWNDESYDNFSIEKMYIYENFIKILNRSIYEKLSSPFLPIDQLIDKSIDCKERFSGKYYTVLSERITKHEYKKLILNSSLGPKMEDIDVYKYILYKLNGSQKDMIKPIIYNLLSKNKVNSKFSDKIETDVIINFMKYVKKIIVNEHIILRQFYIINLYIFLFYIVKYFNKDGYERILASLSSQFNSRYKQYKKSTKIDIDINIFKDIIQNQCYMYEKRFDINLIFNLFDLINYVNKIEFNGLHYKIDRITYELILYDLDNANDIFYKISGIIDRLIDQLIYIIVYKFTDLLSYIIYHTNKDGSLLKKIDESLDTIEIKYSKIIIEKVMEKMDNNGLFNTKLFDFMKTKLEQYISKLRNEQSQNSQNNSQNESQNESQNGSQNDSQNGGQLKRNKKTHLKKVKKTVIKRNKKTHLKKIKN